MEDTRNVRSPMPPLLPRLDRLESLMEYLERKLNFSRWNDDAAMVSPFLPLDLALREAHAKGSLLDRVSSLEHRLVQLSLEMEASSVSSSSTIQTFETDHSVLRQGSSLREQYLSVQNLEENNDIGRPEGGQIRLVNKHDTQREYIGDQKVRSSVAEQLVADARDSTGGGRKYKKQRKSRKNWHYKRLLGC